MVLSSSSKSGRLHQGHPPRQFQQSTARPNQGQPSKVSAPHTLSSSSKPSLKVPANQNYLDKIHVVHHLITHLNTSRNADNPAGIGKKTYSDSKRGSCISGVALNEVRPYQAQVQEHVSQFNQVTSTQQRGSEVIGIDQPAFLHGCLKNRKTPGDLHTTRTERATINFARFQQGVSAFCKRVPPAVASTLQQSMQNMSKQLIPGGNPAVLSDMHRIMLLLMDTFAPQSKATKISFYTDHDSHLAFYNQTPFSAAPIKQVLKKNGDIEIAKPQKQSNSFDTRLQWQAKLHQYHTDRLAQLLEKHANQNTFDIRDHLIVSFPVDPFQDDKSRDINSIMMIHPNQNTPQGVQKMQQLRNYLVNKLVEINDAFSDMEEDMDSTFRLPAGQIKNEDGFSVNEYTALELTGEVLLDDKLNSHQHGQKTLSEQLYHAFIGSYYGTFLPQQNIFAANRVHTDFEGSWRVEKQGVHKSMSMDTNDIPTYLLNLKQL